MTGPREAGPGQLPSLDRSRTPPPDYTAQHAASPPPDKHAVRSQPSLPPLHPAPPTPLVTPSGVRGYDGGLRRSLPAQSATPEYAEQPPNFRIGLLEADYPDELISGLDVVEYYATYGHAANIKVFHLNAVHAPWEGNPYDLRIVARNRVDDDHFTISAAGVVHVIGETGETEFTSLGQWLREMSVYNTMRQMRVFKLYLQRKMIRIWRNAAHARAFTRARDQIESSLFFARPVFSTVLMDAKRHISDMLKSSYLSLPAPGLSWVQAHPGASKWELVQDPGPKNQHFTVKDFLIAQQQHRQVHITAKQDVHMKHIETMLLRLIKDIDDQLQYVGTEVQGFLKDPSSGATKGLSSTRVRLHRMERVKQHKGLLADKARLPSLVRLVDYLLVEHAITGLSRDISNLLSLFQTSSVFDVSLAFKGAAFEVTPGDGEIGRLVTLEVTENFVGCVKNMPRILKLPAFKDLLSGLVQQPLQVATVIFGTRSLNRDRVACDQMVMTSFQQVMTYASTLDNLRPIYEFAKAWDMQKYKDTERTVEQFRADMALVREWMTMLDTMTVGKRIGLLWADCSAVQGELKVAVQKALTTMCMVLEMANHKRVVEVLNKMQHTVKGLRERPQDLHAFVDYFIRQRQLQSQQDEMMADFELVQDMTAMLTEYGGRMRPDDEVVMQNLFSVVASYTAGLQHSEEFIESNKASQVATMKQLAVQLARQGAQVLEKCRNGQFDDATAEPQQMLNVLQDLDASFQALNEKASTFKKYEGLLDVPPEDFSSIDQAAKELSAHMGKWQSLHRFLECREKWLTGKCNELDPVEIETITTEINNKNYKMLKGRPDDAVAKRLQTALTAFRAQMPLLQEMANPALEGRHWKQIFTMLKQPYKEGQTFCVQDLIAFDIEAKLEEVQTVAANASKEYSMRMTLDKMEHEWEGVELKCTAYKDTGTFIIGGVDDVQLLLDDQIVKVQAMNASPFIKPIKARSTLHETTLQTLQDMLDNWLQCQATWLYLEPIFSSEDIVKQMPEEGEKFASVDATWREIMTATHEAPAVVPIARDVSRLTRLVECNALLDEIQKGLAAYLEKKRLFFPRFFFLSNDEMLEILSETKDPTRVQPHLKKCFEGIDNLTFTEELQITHMSSVEKEAIPMKKVIDTNKAAGSVEKWLLEVEAGMFESIHHVTAQGIEDYCKRARHDWVLQWPGMVVLVVTAIFWTQQVTEALKAGKLAAYEAKCTSDLLKIVDLVRGELTKLERATLGALVVMDVHARDVCTQLVKGKVVADSDFAWQAQLRSYWHDDEEGDKDKTVIMHMMSAHIEYGYEYLGNSSRLVITPLTDRCYRTLMGAIHLNLGGAPEGPAGTGKTETTKDLAKALARQCVVFNCSDSLDYLAMGKFFKGLASSGAWACFDEFNRIDLEVLSVVAQQVLDIQRAVGARLRRFTFEGTEMQLKWSAWSSITMNPGYAGRSELPDNLKALFRTVAMMVPDYAMISEISLFSFGYLKAPETSKKIVQCYKLCSEQLSSQDHYDYGMRAVVAVLRAAGNLKRRFPDEDEFVLMLRSIIDVNLCKFLSDDVPLFMGIVGDLFLGVVLPKADYTKMEIAMHETCVEMNLQPTKYLFLKTIQLYEMIVVRHGLMLVGLPFSAKTSAYRLLAGAMTKMHAREEEGQERAEFHVINPKSITMGQLYGQFDPISHEWSDGILAVTFRSCASNPSPDRKWLILDGPVDAIWIENMNTVLDDNKKLCLNSGEIIQMSAPMNMIFEVMDLAVASPATVSRCGMVYLDADQVGWRPLVLSWLATLPAHFPEAVKAHLLGLMDWLVPVSLRFVRREIAEASPTSDGNLITTLQRVFTACMEHLQDETRFTALDDAAVMLHIESVFLFSLVWSIGCSGGTNDGRAHFDAFLRAAVSCGLPGYTSPSGERYTLATDIPKGHVTLKSPMIPSDKNSVVYDWMFDAKAAKWKPWESILDDTPPTADAEVRNIMIATVDTLRYTYVLDLCVRNGFPCLFVGPTGVGKSVYVLKYISSLENERFVPPIVVGFSARTNANMTQQMIDAKLDRRRKGVFGPPMGKKAIIFVDDLNMPQLEAYGAQPPIELLRQYMDHSGWYDRQNTFRAMVDCQFIAAMGPPGGGRNFITPRYARHYNHVAICDVDDRSMQRIFTRIMDWALTKGSFPSAVQEMRDSIILSTMDVYKTSMSLLLPTPTKSHYLSNLRDVSRVMGGLLMLKSSQLDSGAAGKEKYMRLWTHEIMRVFYDRLVDEVDRQWLLDYVKSVMKTRMGADFDKVFKHLNSGKGPVGLEDLRHMFFGDYMDTKADSASERVYNEAQDVNQVLAKMEEFLIDHNATSKRPMNLAIFLYAVEHTSRICRVLKQSGSHMLNVGTGGSGRQSLSRLAAFISEMQAFQIEISKSYTMVEWREDLKRFAKRAGAEGVPCVFLFSDTQIQSESFVEDINNLLNSGEVPNMFPYDERAAILELCRTNSKKQGLALETPAELWNFFIDKTKANLHVVLCFSPVGNAFRERLRQFPSLVNCCTIDWYMPWPRDALEAVAIKFLKEIDMDAGQRLDIMAMCKMFHQDVRALSTKFQKLRGRINYVTPTSYLELITMFTTLLGQQRGIVSMQQKRYKIGLGKLAFTEEQVQIMQEELTALQPNLVKTAKETELLMAQVNKEKTEVVEPKKAIVDADVAAAEASANAANAIKMECEGALSVAMPILEAAVSALDTIKPADIKLVQSFKNPPGAIKLVMEAVCVLLDIKPIKVADPSGSGKKIEDYWDPSKKILGDPGFVKMLKDYDKDNINTKIIEQIRKTYTSNPDFTPANALKASAAAEGLCKWVCAMESYEKVAKVVAPKQASLKIAEGEYNEVMKALNIKQAELKEVMDNLAAMESTLEQSKAKKKQLDEETELCSQKLERAETLIGGLGGEKVRWTDSANSLDVVYTNLTGDMLISAGVISYLGAFTMGYRDEVVSKWVTECKDMGIPSSAKFSLTEALGEPVKIQEWTIFGLPNDSFSIDNAIMVNSARRWPLMIDAQSQANKWIKAMEKPHDLRVIKLTDGDYLRTLENAIQFGIPVLLENIGEELDPSLEPVLLKQVFKQGGVNYIRLGDAQIEFSDQFRFYMTTCLPNPHYLPETAVKVTLLNFMITQDGLSDQLLGVVVAEERPDLEEQRQKLVVQSADNKRRLKEIEDKILQVLSESKGNILEDASAIQILSEAKVISNDIEEKQVVAEETQKETDEARMHYTPCGAYNSVLFFCIRDLASVDPMYQYSLTWFIKLLIRSTQASEKNDDLAKRLDNINAHFTHSLYQNICRSLFERHKLLFAFLLDIRIMLSREVLSSDLLSFLLTGGVGVAEKAAANPAPDWISAKSWGEICRGVNACPAFSALPADMAAHPDRWKAMFDATEPQSSTPPQGYTALQPFEMLILIRMLRPDKLVPAMSDFISATIGQKFIEPPLFDLARSFKESSSTVPLLFVLSTGSDPTAALLKYADERGYGSKISIISMGQGQGPKAAKLIEDARKNGSWALLQNCHLAASWMPSLEKICESIKPENTDPDFRLWMTSMPSPAFPVTILQNAVKMTNEPPAGLRANLKRSFALDPISSDEFFEGCNKPDTFKRMLFGLCFVHALVQERRKFGPIGWNIPYSFDDSDIRISVRQLQMYVNENAEIPFSALKYAIGECNYGGRVTDDKDRRLLNTILERIYRPEIGTERPCALSASGTYCVPEETGSRAFYIEEINKLPILPQPEAFGLHENADITKDLQQTEAMIGTLLVLGGGAGGGEGAGKDEEVVGAMVQDLLAKLPPAFDIEKAQLKYPVRYEESMNQVLCQEMLRYNRLTDIIRVSLIDLNKAVQGLQVMSSELDQVFKAMLIGQVPALWKKKSFPSLKPLASYTKDLLACLKMLQDWYDNGKPTVFWLPGFFFTPSFTTAALQNYARSNKLPIDSVGFDFQMMGTDPAAYTTPPESGIYIYGMFVEGCAWDRDKQVLQESRPKVLFEAAPVMWMKPMKVEDFTVYPHYNCPVYRTPERRGVLATTGHSTNFLMFIKMPSTLPEWHWVMRGVCLLSSLSE